MFNNDEFEFFQHAGVLGMKWGVRRRTNTSSTSDNTNSKKRRMTNKELNSKIRRLRLEEEYKKLTAPPKTVGKISKMVKTIGTVATLSGSAMTIYKNLNELNKQINK